MSRADQELGKMNTDKPDIAMVDVQYPLLAQSWALNFTEGFRQYKMHTRNGEKYLQYTTVFQIVLSTSAVLAFLYYVITSILAFIWWALATILSPVFLILSSLR